MKDKKQLLYFLIPAVCGIWGFVIYRIIDFSGGEEEGLEPINITISGSEEENSKAYPLSLNYPDPFLSRSTSRSATRDKNNSRKEQKKNVRPTPRFDWSHIKYKGVIRHPRKKVAVGLIEISNEEHMLGAGEEANGYRVLEIRNDSISISYKENQTWVRLIGGF